MARAKLAVRIVLGRRANDIAGSPDCMDEFLFGSAVEFCAQPADVSFHNLRLRIEMKVPHVLQQHRPRHYTAGIAHQVFKQLKLTGLQSNILVTAPNPPRNEIHLEVCHPQHGLYVPQWRPAGQGVQPRHELGKGEGFCEVVIPSRFKPFDTIIDAATSSEKKDGGFDPGIANCFYHGQSFEARKHAIDNDCVIGSGSGKDQTIAAIRHMIRRVATTLETFDYISRGLDIILDDKDAHTAVSPYLTVHPPTS